MRARKTHARRGFALLLAGIMCLSMVQITVSGSESGHVHTFACYEDWSLACQEDHNHTAACYAGSGDPACGLEVGASHSHNEAGYTCQAAARVLSCGLTEHTHGPECLPAFEEPAADPSGSQGGDPSGAPAGEETEISQTQDGEDPPAGDSSESELSQEPTVPLTEGVDYTCGLEEHTHSDACYTQVYQCRPAQQDTSNTAQPTAEGDDPLAALREAVKNGGTHSLDDNASGTIPTPITIGGNFVLDLKGNTLEITANTVSANLFVVNGTFTIQDSVGGGKIHFKNGDNVVSVAVGGTLNLEGGTLTSTNCNRAVFTQGNVNMTGGEISNNMGKGAGAGIYAIENAKVTVSGGKICDNTTEGNGGAIAARFSQNTDQVSITIGGTAKIQNNKAASGGGIYVGSTTTLQIRDNAIITGNTGGNVSGIELTSSIVGPNCIVGGYQDEPLSAKDPLGKLIAGSTNGEVVLNENCSTTIGHEIAGELTIDLNGHNIIGTLSDTNTSLFDVKGTLTIKVAINSRISVKASKKQEKRR